jgi:uncharacterized protein (DUF4415 family)
MARLGKARRGRARCRLGVYVVAYAGAADSPDHSENGKPIMRISANKARRLADETDYTRLDRMSDDDIAQAVAQDPDSPPLDIDWARVQLIMPPRKVTVTIRLDQDLLDWFRAQGKGYQTRVNAVLRTFYEAKRNCTGGGRR